MFHFVSPETHVFGKGLELVVRLHPNRRHPVSAEINGRIVWNGLPLKWHPWKVEAFSIDGNPGFVVGLYRLTRLFPFPVHTLYVYGFDGSKVYPRWRGSFLGRDFSDFEVVGNGKTQKLAVLEKTVGGKLDFGRFDWTGFGFAKEWQTGDWPSARLGKRGGLIEVLSSSGHVLYTEREESTNK